MPISYPPLVQRGLRKLWRYWSRIIQKLPLPFGTDLQPQRWIFVVGCYNSGTTLLARILAEHPLIGALPDEGVFYTDSLPYPEQFGWMRMWAQCLDRVRLNPDDVTPEVIRRIKKQWSLWYPNDTPNLLEKSVANATRMPFLQVHFHPAYFIAIVRNGYAVAEGIRRKAHPSPKRHPSFHGTYPIELCAEQWRTCDEIITGDRAKLKHFKQIYYEDLTADPKRVLREITDFLGLPPLEQNLFDRSWVIQEKNEPLRNMNPDSFRRLSATDFQIIERVAGDCLAKHCYYRLGLLYGKGADLTEKALGQ